MLVIYVLAPQNGHQPKPGGGGGGLNAFYLRLVFSLDYVVVKTQPCLARMEAS